jgi:hypothetical protein
VSEDGWRGWIEFEDGMQEIEKAEDGVDFGHGGWYLRGDVGRYLYR